MGKMSESDFGFDRVPKFGFETSESEPIERNWMFDHLSAKHFKRASHRSRFRQRYRCVGRYDYVRMFTPKKCGLAVTERKRFFWFFRHYLEIRHYVEIKN